MLKTAPLLIAAATLALVSTANASQYREPSQSVQIYAPETGQCEYSKYILNVQPKVKVASRVCSRNYSDFNIQKCDAANDARNKASREFAEKCPYFADQVPRTAIFRIDDMMAKDALLHRIQLDILEKRDVDAIQSDSITFLTPESSKTVQQTFAKAQEGGGLAKSLAHLAPEAAPQESVSPPAVVQPPQDEEPQS